MTTLLPSAKNSATKKSNNRSKCPRNRASRQIEYEDFVRPSRLRIQHPLKPSMPVSQPNTNQDHVGQSITTSETSNLAPTNLRSPAESRKTVDRLVWMRDRIQKDLKQTEQRLVAVQDYLGISDQVTDALDSLSQKLFEEVLGLLQQKLTIALQEVLEQPIKFKADASFKRGAASVDFSIERDGNSEDVNRGQGGSVQNVLSVGLRLFALARLDAQEHRRFLVLDEQDCWLRPDLVPRLVNIVHRAAKELNFQVIMISHHEVGLFEKFADKIYRFTPTKEGAVVVEEVSRPPGTTDFADK